jgi:hypothetical protein
VLNWFLLFCNKVYSSFKVLRCQAAGEFTRYERIRIKMKAWLITWDWTGDAAAVADVVVGILNPRWGDRRVTDIVEFLYSNTTANVSELSHYAKKPSNNPYRKGGRCF